MQNLASVVVMRPQTLQILPDSGSGPAGEVEASASSDSSGFTDSSALDFVLGLATLALTFVSTKVVSVISKRLTGPLRILDSFWRMYRAAVIA